MDNKTRSYFIYFGLMIFIFFLADYAEKRNKKKYIFFIALALGLIMGLKKNTVGIDASNYYGLFSETKSISDVFSKNDPFFYLYAFILMKINNDAYFPMFVFSMITNFLMVYRLWEFRKDASFKYSLLRYYTIFYFFSFNCLRQFLAISIVFWATRYLEKSDYFTYLIYVVLAVSVHASSILAASLIIIDILKWDKLNIKQRYFVIFSLVGTPIYIFVAYFFTRGRFEKYFDVVDKTDARTLFIKIALLFIVLIFLYNEKKFTRKNYQPVLYSFYYFLGLIFVFLGTYFQFVERIGYYFYIYCTVYVGMAAREKKYMLLFRVIILFIIIRAFLMNMNMNSMGQMPYLFYWE